MIRSSVVFPEPEGPSRARSAPLGTSRLTLSSARNLSKRLVTRVIRMPIRSEYHRAGPDEERELRALLRAQHPVQPVERAHRRLAHALRALDPRPPRLGRPGGVEAVLGEHVGERRRHAPVVDGGLRALGLELVEDARHLACLRLVEPELEGEKAQRSPHPEGGGAEEARSRRDPGRGLLPRGARVGAAAGPEALVMMHHGSLSSRRRAVSRWKVTRFCLAPSASLVSSVSSAVSRVTSAPSASRRPIRCRATASSSRSTAISSWRPTRPSSADSRSSSFASLLRR